MFLKAGLLVLGLILTGCGGDDSGVACTVTDKKQVVNTLMHDVYYWYDEVPDVDPANYADMHDLLDTLILPEKSRGHVYSYLTTVAAEEAFLSNAAYVGFGFSMGIDLDGRIFLKESFEEGPAHDAGMRRGDEIISVNGRDVSTMTVDQFNESLGPDEEGYAVTFGIRHPDTTTDTYTIEKAEVETPIVAHVQTDLGAEGDTTYIFFRSFVDPAFDALDEAFAQMKAAGDTQLVLDLRYNGGGLVSVAQHLGSLIGGIDYEGEIVAELEFNDRYQSENEAYLLELLTNSVDVTDMVVITTDNTASASEMIINGLDPFINVTTVGSTSYGKPVGQSRLNFDLLNTDCTEDILRGVTFKVVNAEGVGEYYTGFVPDCPADDDVLDQLGSTDEESLASALYYLENGSCNTAVAAKARYAQAKRMSLQPEGDPFIRDGWDLLTGGAR
ncbi:MAG TPA: S41 family peptidase [Gammaproteobacteria bacterium]